TWGCSIATWPPGSTRPDVGQLTTQYQGTTSWNAWHRLSVDGNGKLFAAAYYGSELPVAGRMLTTAGANDAIAFRFDRAGNVDWAGHYGTGGDESDIHVHATPTKGVFIAGYEGAPSTFVARFDVAR